MAMQVPLDPDTVRERLDELGEELQTVASLVHLSIKNQQHEGVDDAEGAFDCSGDAERKFQDLKGEVQGLARALDSDGSSLASLTAGNLTDVNRLADQAARCKAAMGALDGLCQAEQHLTSSQQLLAKNEYGSAADAIASAEVLLADLQRQETASANGRGGRLGGGVGGGVDKENRRNGGGGDSGVLRALKRLLLKRRTGLESHLRDVANSSVELGVDGTTIRCRKVLSGYLCERYFRSPVSLSTVFDALARLGQLDALFDEMSRRLRKEAIDPLLSPRHVPPPKRFSDEKTASLSYAPAQASSGPGAAVDSTSKAGAISSIYGGDAGGEFKESSVAEMPGVATEFLVRISTVLEFVHEEVLGGQAHLSAALGTRLLSGRDGLSKALLDKLEDNIPHSAQQLVDFELGARGACQEFETHLASMGYLGGDGVGSEKMAASRGSLCRFVDTVEVRFAAKRRRTLLQQARDLAIGDYHNSVEVSDALEGFLLADTASAGGVSSEVMGKARRKERPDTKTFRLEACQVSSVAKCLVALVRAALAEACSDQTPPFCAKELFRTARDMLDLFRAVVPVQHGNALDGVPRIAAVFQNDCLYLAHHMVTLGHEFRQGLPPPANVTATMVDTIPLFRELAAQSLGEQQRRQQRQLQEFFTGVDVLASTESSASLIDAADSAFEGIFSGGDSENVPGSRGGGGGGLDRGWMAAGGRGSPGSTGGAEAGYGTGEEGGAVAAVRKSVYHLRQLKQAWCKVLPDRVYKRSMGALLSLVAGKVCTPVLGAADLGEEQTHALHRIFKTLGEAAQDIFESEAEAEEHTPGWSKAVVVGQLMELGLDAIGEMLHGDVFRPLTTDELGGLVRAIFQDTPARTSVLVAVGQTRE